MSQSTLAALIEDERTNAVIAWAVVAAIAAIGVAELVTGGMLWSAFATALLSLAVLPPVAYRSARVMLPWEVLGLAALPVLGMAIGADGITGHFTSYLSVAAIALVLAVELQTFTKVRMTPGFAVVFVVVATMATAALWALLRWSSAGLLGTTFAPDHDAIMWEFVYSALAGVGGGVVFERYFRRIDGRQRRVQEALGPEVVDSDG